MGFPILVRCHLYIESGPKWFFLSRSSRIAPQALGQSWQPQCQWSNPEGYGWNWHTPKHNKAWTACVINSLRPRQNGRHFPDDIFKWIFLNENVWITIKISLKFVPKGPINNIPALVQITAWRCPGDKPLSEPMMVILLMHICVTQPQWVNGLLWCIT